MTRAAAPSASSGPRLALTAWLVAWAAAIVYATLYPWIGWRAPTVAPAAFLLDGWPRYWTGLDLGLNVVGYVPLGFLAALRFARGRPGIGAALAATTLAALLSFGLESLQALLPSRISSVSDLVANVAGGGAGAVVAAAIGPAPLQRLADATARHLPLAPAAGPGALLLLLWLVVQWRPQSIAFASGELGGLLATVAPGADRWLAGLALAPEHGPLLEATAVAATVFGVGLLARDTLRPATGWTIALPIVLAATVKSAASATLLGARHALAWLNAGTQGGLLAGALALALAAWWPSRVRGLAAAAALALATTLYNLAPPNVYFQSTMAAWNQGELANLNGLLRALAIVWPFAAILWCLARLRLRGPRPIIGRL